MHKETLIIIESSYFVAGIVYNTSAGEAIIIAPIIKYMKQWSISKIIQYCEKKHWKVTTVKDEDKIAS